MLNQITNFDFKDLLCEFVQSLEVIVFLDYNPPVMCFRRIYD